MHEKRYEEVYQALEQAGEGGMTIARLARVLRCSKSTAWNTVNEMVERELVNRVETPQGNSFKRITYHYFQLELFKRGKDFQCGMCYEFFNGEHCPNCGNLDFRQDAL